MDAFAGEPWLDGQIPSYEEEQNLLTGLILVASGAWLFIMPNLLASEPSKPKEVIIVKRRVVNGISRVIEETKEQQGALDSHEKRPAVVKSAIGYVFTIFFLILRFSPNNYFVSRRVFQSPLLTRSECQTIIGMTSRAAERSYQKALEADPLIVTEESGLMAKQRNKSLIALKEAPRGWQKTRHGNYPTTDLNLVTDPFTKSDRQWLREILDRRLAPTLARLYGIPVASIRANDLFVVRYDADKRAHLNTHTDDGDISFNILLNDGFAGGGTRFFDRVTERPFAHVQPNQPGQVLTHSALIHHEGVAITEGTRMILVGFLSVDRVDPWTRTPTGMSWYSSWLSLPWMSVKFKEGYQLSQMRRQKDNSDDNNGGQSKEVTSSTSWKDSPYFRSYFNEMYALLTYTGDAMVDHAVTQLVPDPVEASRYLQALDHAHASAQQQQQQANWFRGHGLNIDIDGTIDSEWSSRRDNLHLYKEL